jgi:hypothetical protein
MKEQKPPARMTEEEVSLEEAYKIARFESLTPREQRILLTHQLDQFEAIPSYVERFRTASSSSSLDDKL